MTEERIEEILLQLLEKVSAIETQLQQTNAVITNHENRIITLERHPSNAVTYEDYKADKADKTEDFKSKMIELICKSLVISLTALASLVGAGGILSKIMNL